MCIRVCVCSDGASLPPPLQTEAVAESLEEDSPLFAAAAVVITAKLAVATEPEPISLLPTDLNTTNSVLSSVISSLESSLEEASTDPASSMTQQQEVSVMWAVIFHMNMQEVGVCRWSLSLEKYEHAMRLRMFEN